MCIRLVTLVACAALITGCASVGQDFDMAEVDRFQPGVTTIEQAKEKLGKPGSITNTANGEVGFVWSRSQVVMGAGKWKSVGILFDKDGKMVRVVLRSESASN